MSRAEAGRKGGKTTKQRYGASFFGEISRKGGKKGGERTKRRYGIEFYQRIGRKGGSRYQPAVPSINPGAPLKG